MHRTDSIDYAVVMSGRDRHANSTMAEVHLKAGDVLVQRGTIHKLGPNRSAAPCLIAFVLVDAKPVVVAGKVLNASG